MPATTAPSESKKEKAASLLADALRDHYGDRLWKAVRIPEDPYEGESTPETVFVVAVLNGDVTPYAEVDDVGVLSEAVDSQLDFDVYTTVFLTSRQAFEEKAGFVARAAREDGTGVQ